MTRASQEKDGKLHSMAVAGFWTCQTLALYFGKHCLQCCLVCYWTVSARRCPELCTSLHSHAIDQGLAPLDLMDPGKALNGHSLVTSWKCFEYC